MNRFSKDLSLQTYSRGMGAIGLPGDLSSASRFVRAAFTRLNAKSEDGEMASVSQFFHILTAVEQTRGCCELENGKFEITLYSSCCNADKGIYYYTTYENRQITAVSLFEEDLDARGLGALSIGEYPVRPVPERETRITRRRCISHAPPVFVFCENFPRKRIRISRKAPG